MQACQGISRQIRDNFRYMTIHYIPHHEGQRMEAFGLAHQEIMNHPAGKTASQILARANGPEGSALIGIAAAQKSLLLGLSSQTSMLALCSINVDQYRNLKEIRRHAYHLAWHALDVMRYHEQHNFERGGVSSREVVIRKRSALEVAAANLRADVFSTVIAALQDDGVAIRKAALGRSLDTLQALPLTHPEFYPYVVALDATAAAYKLLKDQSPPRKRYFEIALRTAEEIGKTFDTATLKQWLAFSQPAQDMAWRGYRPEEILSAAINTSEDTYVRAIGYMVSEVTEIKPASILTIRENYSPFADEAFNAKLHESAVNRVFEDIIARGIQMNSTKPFLEAANRQNHILTEGHVVGWCAAALQAAAGAFEIAMKSNREPGAAARKEFTGARARTPWEALKDLGVRIVDQYRQGNFVTLANLSGLCQAEPAFATIRKSIDMTVRDPCYQNSLQAASELTSRPSMGPAPQRPAPSAPLPSRALHAGMPGLGGGGMGMPSSVTIPPVVRTAIQAEAEQATE
ncbi:MAG TPA: hypothetical protein VIG74_02515 [Alphaproteobacteria bacterium]